MLKIVETGAFAFNLDVKENTYTRGGLGLTGDAKRLIWSVSAGADYILSGEKEETTSKFADTNFEYQSRSAELEKLASEGNIAADSDKHVNKYGINVGYKFKI